MWDKQINHRHRLESSALAQIAESSVPKLQQFLQVNVLGILLALRAETRAMKLHEARLVSRINPIRGKVRGRVINMGSCSSYCATAQLGQYTTSKQIVLGLTRNTSGFSFLVNFTAAELN